MLDDVWTARSALFASFALPRFRVHIDPDAALVGVSSRRPIQLIQAGELLVGSGGIAKFLNPSSARRCGALASPAAPPYPSAVISQMKCRSGPDAAAAAYAIITTRKRTPPTQTDGRRTERKGLADTACSLCRGEREAGPSKLPHPCSASRFILMLTLRAGIHS